MHLVLHILTIFKHSEMLYFNILIIYIYIYIYKPLKCVNKTNYEWIHIIVRISVSVIDFYNIYNNQSTN